ncbi:UbiA prenyltransferase family-domain-containing protein [Leucosporidium creatinivorum]|uniref:Protoheme IX farnesyltransferase, mitochondrial n=1 Tax=Leucosporidium creatinivorum TaxID=106004 RepID=A0A1Y2DC28_9BASI|nr:UbiA prenyltransferase family-domain-containing protein [Leucosporidium creatinivorum]
MLSRLSPSTCLRCRQLSPSPLRLFSTLRSPNSTTTTRPLLGSSSSIGWKGKGRASEVESLRWSSSGRRTLLEGSSAATAGARRSASSSAGNDPPPAATTPPTEHVYAHEDLLSTVPSKRNAAAGRSPRNSSTSGYFSRSFDTPEAPLPPPSTSPLVPLSTPLPRPLPPSVLSNGLPNPEIRWRPRPPSTIPDDLEMYKSLGKARLSALVVLTAMAGYTMCPVDPTSTQAAMEALAQSLSSSLPAGTSLDSLAASTTPSSSTSTLSSSPANNLTLSVLLPATVGTALCSASAAAFNELIEAPYDAQMARTRNRPLPRRYMTPLQASSFGALTGVVGITTLYALNPLSAAIGLGTIILYCPIYTILKRHTIYNTWLGSIVGSLPPLIGWAACTASLNPLTQPGAWALFALMYFWQFPHFMALSHTLRSSYASSGYRMLAVLDPAKNALVSLRYALALLPLSFTFPLLGLTNAFFPWLSLAPNGLLAVTAWRFWRRREERRAKELFWASLVQLPVVLMLAMVCKKGLWGGEEEEEEEEEEDGEEEEEAEVRA